MSKPNNVVPITLGGWGKNTVSNRKEPAKPQKTDMERVRKRRAVEESIEAKRMLESWGIGA